MVMTMGYCALKSILDQTLLLALLITGVLDMLKPGVIYDSNLQIDIFKSDIEHITFYFIKNIISIKRKHSLEKLYMELAN